MIPRKKIRLFLCIIFIFYAFVDGKKNTTNAGRNNYANVTKYLSTGVSDDFGTTDDFSTPIYITTTEVECEDPPNSVQNLTVFNRTHNSITVTWIYEPFLDCVSYFRLENLSGSYVTDGPVLEYVISNLKSCTTYNISVIAVGKNNNSSPANTVSATTKEAHISSVSNLRAEGNGDGLIIFWDPPSDVACLKNYKVSATMLNNVTVKSTNISSKATNHTFSDLSACTDYVVEVTPVSINNNSGTVATAEAQTKPKLPGAISDLTVEKEAESYVYLTWSAPTENAACVLNYNVIICEGNDCTTHSTPNAFYNATALSPCLSYKFTVGAVGTVGSSETLSKNATTTYVSPSEPQSLEAIPGQFSITVYWDPPKIGSTCVTGYRVTLEETGETQRTTDTNITFFELHACKEYNTQVIPVRGTSDGLPARILTTVQSSVEDPPELDTERLWSTKDTITIGWRIKRNKNECTLKSLRTVCNFTSTDGHGFVPSNETSSLDITASNSNVTTNITVKNLSPFSTYTCNGYTENSAGYSDSSVAIVTTLEDVPSGPNITASNFTNTSFILDWGEPGYLAGILIDHEIHFSRKENFLTPDSCDHGELSNSIPDIGGTLRSWSYSNATPYSTYYAKIRAKTNAGWGEYGRSVTFQTQSGVPGIVRNIVYSNPANASNTNMLDTFLSWQLPCSLNGEIESFNLSVHGTRENFTNHIFSYNYNVEGNITANHNFTHNFGELNAEYNYTFQISAKVKEVSDYGMYNIYNVMYPAGIPPMPDEKYMTNIKIDPYDAKRSSSTVTVLLPLFKNTNGKIRYYAIMVSQYGYNIYTSSRYDIQNGKWPIVSTWAQSKADEFTVTYQATGIRWHPNTTDLVKLSDNSTAVKFTLGQNIKCSESSTTESYCNGPLLPETSYQIRMRAFTNGGFSDSGVFVARTKAEFNSSLVIGVVFGILFLGIMATMMLLVRKGGLQAILRNPGAQTSPVPDPLTRKKFELHCQDLIENPGKLSNEFQLLHTLSVDLQMSTNDALLQANRKKNRYLDILPYDISRVKLDLIDNDPNTDYINASFIHGYTGTVEYIACQGPKEETTYDFWRMIFQYNVKVIVMVTQLVEKGKEKCHQYYPNMRENFEYEDITIRCSTQLDFVFYTQRNIVLQMEDVKRTVTHLHFKEWSDHGVPDDFHSMLHFCQTVRKQMNENKGVAVIHCSAGVGRTGTLITVDILLQHIRDNKRLDVFGTVFNLRKDRINMVQTESQYAYIYNCTRQALNNPYSFKHCKASSIDPVYETLTKTRNEITDSNTNLVNSAETLKKISPSSSIDSMEPIYEVMRQRPSYDTQLSTLSNGLRYTKSTGAIDQPISPGVEIVRYGSHTYPIFEPAPDTLSNRGSMDRNTLLRYTMRPVRTRLE